MNYVTTALSKMSHSALTERWPVYLGSSAGVSALKVGPMAFFFLYSWPNKLTPTVSVNILAVPVCASLSSKGPRKNKTHWSFSPAAMDESFMATLSAEGISAALAA